LRCCDLRRPILQRNPRYGPQIAEDFFNRAKDSGDDYLQFQVHYFAEYPGGSGWFDVVGLTGLAEAHQKQIRQWTCDNYPILLMIGIEPRFIKNGTLYVSRNKNITTIISLSKLSKVDKPLAMRLLRSNQLLCADLRAADFNSDERKCADVSSFFRR
jgi:hypothetical protein